MKKYLILVLMCFTLALFGQADSTEVLFKTAPLTVRGQFGLRHETARVNQSILNSLGIELGLNFNKKLFLGFYGIVSLTSPKNIAWGDTPIDPSLINHLSFLEGGGLIGYRFKPYKAVHFAAFTKFGGTSIEDNGIPTTVTSDAAFVFVPQVEAELNLTRSIRLGIGIGYRFTKRTEEFFKQNETNSLVFSTTLRFGKFAK